MLGKVFPRWLARGLCLWPHLPHPLYTPLLAEVDTTLFPVTLFPLISRLFGATTFLEMRTKGRGLSTPASGPIKATVTVPRHKSCPRPNSRTPARRHNGTECADPGCLSSAPPPGQPGQCLSSAPDNTACRPPDPGYSWSHNWLEAWAAEAEEARHSLPHLHLLLWLLLSIKVWDLLQDVESPCPPLPLFIPVAL